MLDPQNFKQTFVEPAVTLFVSEPTSLIHACTVIWCLDAFASHVALSQTEYNIDNSPNKRFKAEKEYKDAIACSSEDGGWQFQIIREVSNALKHGWKMHSKIGASSSNLLSIETIDGSLFYFHGPSRAPYWGPQVVCHLNILFDESQNCFLDENGNAFKGPFLRWVPIIGLIEPTLRILGFPSPSEKPLVRSDWPNPA